ncbi:MAG: magnesium-translocating P-type ATPase [Syntrophobacterales bacterium]|nr:magnesium-translocating P-type ATPase [Syntrophobacterales bacterium]
MTIIPKKLGAPKHPSEIQVSPEIMEVSVSEPEQVYQKLGTSNQGLSEVEAARRLAEHGPNVVAQDKRHNRWRLFGRALINPLVILLSILATVSALTGDLRATVVMAVMVVLGVVLRFVQEARADTAAAKLKAMISVNATVVRDGQTREIPLAQLVPGDVVHLAAGDMIPADVRLISCKDLFIIQASLTGESFPVEKFAIQEASEGLGLLELQNICFLGTSVERGTGLGVVVMTGVKTYLGSMASALVVQEVQTSFDKGVSQFTWLMIRFILVMVPLVFVINGLTKHNWQEAFFFAMAVAVGMTPEMLPMIVTVCLSKGAMAMSKKKVIVKRLNAIQNFGAMDILCTDKTGTLTMDRVILEKHCDVTGEDDKGVLLLAYLNSFFQTGLKNVLDRAVLAHKEHEDSFNIPNYRKVDEVPFDFARKLMSVVVETPEGAHRLICKGAPEEVFKRCAQFELQDKFYPMDHHAIGDMEAEYEQLSKDGFRVLALAYKDLEKKPAYSTIDENDLILRGYVAFLDPPKDSTAPAIRALHAHGVSVKILTGDNELVSEKICREVKLDVDHVLLGTQIETMPDAELSEAVESTTLFVRLTPGHKQRIIRALQGRGHVVGFMGDGINDAPALHTADVGISVDSAVDIAKETADLILLEKSLMVLDQGVIEGRKIFANILKYIRMGASSSFGNMFSVVGASAFLPFVPMAPIQILTNNLLYDFSQVPIPADDVDPEQIAQPRPWSMREIYRFIVFIGPCSSIFDYTTFFMMLYFFNCWDNAALFQTGWFVESILTQTLIIHVIRTNKFPFLQSRASWPVIVTTTVIMMIGMWLPISPIATSLGFETLPSLYWPLLALTLLCYVFLTQGVKVWLLRKAWI